MPRDGTATRERILAAAQRLMIDDGYSATSVDDVLTAAATSKGAFFHHFESKLALADALVERYVANDLELLDEGLAMAAAAGDDPVNRAIAFVRHYEDMAGEIMAGSSGCLYTTVLAESGLISVGRSEPILAAIIAWRDRFAELLTEAVATRPGAGDDLDIDALSDHFFVTFEGSFLLARATSDPDHMRRQLATYRRLLEALLA